MSPNEYTLDDLVRETGFTARQIRFYITKRLVPGAGDRGPNATYGEETLRRLRTIAQLKDISIAPTGRRMTLDEIGHAMDALGDEKMQALLDGEAEFGVLDTDGPRALEVALEGNVARAQPERLSRVQLLAGEPRECRARPVLESPQSKTLEDHDIGDTEDPGSARDYIAALRADKSADVELPLTNMEERPRFALNRIRALFAERRTPGKGGEEEAPLHDLLNRLQIALRDLATDNQVVDPKTGAEQWVRIHTPDVEFHVRKPDDQAARLRLIKMANELAGLLARED